MAPGAPSCVSSTAHRPKATHILLGKKLPIQWLMPETPPFEISFYFSFGFFVFSSGQNANLLSTNTTEDMDGDWAPRSSVIMNFRAVRWDRRLVLVQKQL